MKLNVFVLGLVAYVFLLSCAKEDECKEFI